MNVDYQIIRRYLDGEGTEEDRNKIFHWFSDLTSEKDLRNKYYRYWKGIENYSRINYNEDIPLGKIYHKIMLLQNNNPSRKKLLNSILSIITKAAAVLFIPLIIYTFLEKDKQDFSDQLETSAFSEIYAPLGTRTMFTLPDGTKGWLNSGSSLKFPVNFRNKERRVNLNGEAYFHIKTIPDKPFIVSGKQIDIKAYGTSFNAHIYHEDKFYSVTLINGIIEIEGKRNGITDFNEMIYPGNIFTYNAEYYSYDINPVDTTKVIAWKNGKLVFRSDTFDEVVEKINRWYNVNMIIMDDELKKYTYRATFQDETLEEILKLLKYSAPIDYKNLDRKRNQDGTYDKRRIEIYYNPRN